MRLCFSEAPIAVNEIHLNNRSWSRFSGEGDAFGLEAAEGGKAVAPFFNITNGLPARNWCAIVRSPAMAEL
jgi:hypothetical protein